LKSFTAIIGSYFLSSAIIVELFQLINIVSVFSGFLIFIIIKESKNKHLFRYYFFSICLCTLLITMVISAFFVKPLLIIEGLVSFLFVFTFFILFYIEFIKKAKIESGLILRILITILPFLILLIGLFLTSGYSMDLLPLQFRFIGSIFQLYGFAFFAFFFLKFPILSEFDWKDKIEQVFIINEGGLCIFYKSYNEKLEEVNESLISGAITSVNIMLKELMNPVSRGMSVIRKKGIIIYMFHGNLINGVVFSNKEAKIIEFYMKQLITKIEQVYKNVLQNWDGDLRIFEPIEDIFSDIFSK